MKLKYLPRIVFALALATASYGAFAQNANSGEIKGTVTDPSNAVIPGVQVTVTNVLTGVTVTTTTNDAGIYDLPSLETGKYRLTFNRDGFGETIRDGVTLSVATIAIDAQMRVGATSQQMVVTADAPLVQTEDSGQRVDFNAQEVQQAPTVGGIWYNELTNELPGVNGGGGQDASGQGIGINGTQGYSGSFLMEGSTATQPRATGMPATTILPSMPSAK